MRVTWYGHSCFLLETAEHRLLFDPFLSQNPTAPLRPEEVRCTHLLCTHAHEDHVGDALAIARANDAEIIAPYELAEYLSHQGARVSDPLTGGVARFAFGEVKLTRADHSSALEQSRGRNLALGVAAGFIVTAEGKRIYHAGDTALFSDMRLFGRPALDLALLPIGDHYTMGVDDAVLALEYLCPARAIPMHFGTTPQLHGDPADFERKARAAGHHVTVLRPGESTEV